jgi:hypothetical protein
MKLIQFPNLYMKAACSTLSSNLVSDDLAAWPEVDGNSGHGTSYWREYNSFCEKRKTLMTLDPVIQKWLR